MNPIDGLHARRPRAWEKRQHSPSTTRRRIAGRSARPWFRRFSARIGLQGKLIGCFFLLILLCSVLNCWMFARQSGDQLNGLMGDQARQLSTSLALSSEDDIEHENWNELTHLGQDLIKSRDILFVGFLNKDFQTRALASRDLDFRLPDLGIDGSKTQAADAASPEVLADFRQLPGSVRPRLQLAHPAGRFAADRIRCGRRLAAARAGAAHADQHHGHRRPATSSCS